MTVRISSKPSTRKVLNSPYYVPSKRVARTLVRKPCRHFISSARTRVRVRSTRGPSPPTPSNSVLVYRRLGSTRQSPATKLRPTNFFPHTDTHHPEERLSTQKTGSRLPCRARPTALCDAQRLGALCVSILLPQKLASSFPSLRRVLRGSTAGAIPLAKNDARNWLRDLQDT